MAMKRTIIPICILFVIKLWAIEPWTSKDFERVSKEKPNPSFSLPQGEENWQSWSYPHQFMKTVGFIVSMQVTDSTDPEYGGIIEGEDQLNIVETDNTQEAIWVLSRYKEITGKSDLDQSLMRAWIYVQNHPAYNEEGTESDYYRVWNSGLALMAESKYREVTGDSSFIGYADSCVEYIMTHPLPFSGVHPFYKNLHPKVTAQAAGMLYRYARERNRDDWASYAVQMAESVLVWLEEDPETRLNNEVWAMSGGTCIWGIENSLFREDSSLGASWLSTYLPLMKTFQPGGDWSNSWNIWYAWAYRYAFDYTGDSTYLFIHHAIVDSLLMQDKDDDGGVPPTYGGSSFGDHSWVSSYMLFMGINELWPRLAEYDAGIPKIIFPKEERVIRFGDTLDLEFLVANYGLQDLVSIPLQTSGLSTWDTTLSLDFAMVDTIFIANGVVARDSGYQNLSIYTTLTQDQRTVNDTLSMDFFVFPPRLVTGSVTDSINSHGVKARVYFTLKGDTIPFDSTETDSETGQFSINLLDTTFYVKVSPEVPYPEVYDTVTVTHDNIPTLEYRTAPSKILFVNVDPEGNYEEFLLPALDSLGISYYYWEREQDGEIPFSKLYKFQDSLILWMTGDREEETVTETEADSLTNFVENGGRLFITGQNVAEDLQGSQFLNNVLGVEFISSPINEIFCFPIHEDTLGSLLRPFITTNGGSALNQTSRDWIQPTNGSRAFLSYDSTGSIVAGVWKGDNVPQVVFLGFGLEGIGWSQSFPDYMNRREVMEQILGSMGVTGVKEEKLKSLSPFKVVILENPTFGSIKFSLVSGETIRHLRIFDVQGRRVMSIPINYKPVGIKTFSIPISLPSGLYFLRFDGRSPKTYPVVFIKEP